MDPRLTANSDDHYVSYLLRLWQVVENGKAGWRATLEEPRTGKRHVFSSAGSLVEFLSALTHSVTPIHVEHRINSVDQLNFEVRVRIILEGEGENEAQRSS
jgi:hypothetical protein